MEMSRAVIIEAPQRLVLGEVAIPEVGRDEIKVRIGVGGICGSDLHYYRHGGFGTVRIKAPMVLGHEIAGEVVEVGATVEGLAVGTRVAVNPSLPCGVCANCQRGLRNHCSDMRFFGSAMRTPHVDGAFRDVLVCKASQAVPIPDHVTMGEAALAEPFAVCLHAVNQAGTLIGKRVLITGAGPIGLLTVAAARLGGAAEITITDVLAPPLVIASRTGADRAINTATDSTGLEDAVRRGGKFDAHFEASGSPHAFGAAIAALGARGISVLIGQGAEVPLKVSSLIANEIQLRGSFRFDGEFALAVQYLGQGRVDTKALITATLPVTDLVEAFELAGDKNRSMKVQMAFD